MILIIYTTPQFQDIGTDCDTYDFAVYFLENPT